MLRNEIVEYKSKIAISNGLINFWPFNGNFDDIIGGAHLTPVVNSGFSSDRLNRASSALDLNFGYCSAPPGVYFNGDFTVTFWVTFKTDSDWLRIFDFGNGLPSDNVVIGRYDSINKPFYIFIDVFYDASTSYTLLQEVLILNQWYFVSMVLEIKTMKIYLNSTLKITKQISSRPKIITRKLNYFGKSNWNNNANSNIKLDDFKIFNRALNETEIFNEMNTIFF